MAHFDTIIRNAQVIDGGGNPSQSLNVAILDDKIASLNVAPTDTAEQIIDASGYVLSPGFIDSHTHDDLEAIRNPEMHYKLSQGVATVVAGNCGISASPAKFEGYPPDPMNLLGDEQEFRFQRYGQYIAAINEAKPAVNVIGLVGHTALRASVMNDLHRPATEQEIEAMREMLIDALESGAKGLSTGLAYHNAKDAPTSEILSLASELKRFDALYTTHLRTEFEGILDAMDEAFQVGQNADVPVVISHIKCAGAENWGRSKEVLSHLDNAKEHQHVGCDCYPYSASSSTLDLNQVTDKFDIDITWSKPHPECSGKKLAEIASEWGLPLRECAEKLQPAGAVYHGMLEDDVKTFLSYPDTMVGSDGLPCDPHPHPRLWGSFPRVLGHYCREEKIFPLEQAIHKMTGLTATEYKLEKRGFIREGYYADLTLFDPDTVKDLASFSEPKTPAQGIACVWVNGKLAFSDQNLTQSQTQRCGKYLTHRSK